MRGHVSHPEVTVSERLYYLQDTRQYVGNDILWWAKDSHGYTCDIDKAHVWTWDELRTEYDRGLDRSVVRAWPKEYIDARVKRHVDMQYCSTQGIKPEDLP